jgi:hypothetical protein
MLWTVMIPPTSAQQTIGEGYGRPPTIARTLKIGRAGQQVGTLRTPRRRRKNFDVKHAFIERATPAPPCGDYVPTGLVVMALRNASGEAMVEMVCMPSPEPRMVRSP